MDSKTKILADQTIKELLLADVDGETMQYIIEGVHMKYQMLKQLVVTSSDFDVNNVLEERSILNL